MSWRSNSSSTDSEFSDDEGPKEEKGMVLKLDHKSRLGVGGHSRVVPATYGRLDGSKQARNTLSLCSASFCCVYLIV